MPGSKRKGSPTRRTLENYQIKKVTTSTRKNDGYGRLSAKKVTAPFLDQVRSPALCVKARILREMFEIM